MRPDIHRLYDVTEATWPPADRYRAGPWTLRNGAGGGKRVSAATQAGPWTEDDLAAAESAMQLLDQDALFMIREGEEALDAALDQRAYRVIDPVNVWLCPISLLTAREPPYAIAFAIWEPLALMVDMWHDAGIGPGRIAVMERVAGPKTGLLIRDGQSPAGVAFCAVDGDVAMVHALEVLAEHRNRGMGGWLMRRAALWAQGEGAAWMSVLCTQQNEAANALYASLGMDVVGRYHYRMKTQTSEAEAT